MGICYTHNQDYLKGLLFFQKSLDLIKEENDKAFIINNMATAYELSQNFDYALALYLEAHKILPNSFLINFNLATIYLKAGNQKKAQQYLNLFRSHQTKDPEILHALASLAMLSKSYKEGINYYASMKRENLAHLEFYNHYKVMAELSKTAPIETEIIKSNHDIINEKYENIQSAFERK